ncbi:putative zinc-binding metallopeptidase [Paracoccus caeni]|uniref:Zinc-binding metallopeptidase n=1 Tax=Paracoccus caeni TaxID=657651 RepID=A0A934W1N5_9RHOB|nr:putative zinc-binding metallopeptidase [Paracoccus caeni]MBK4216974.1 putative zinc-binding metallopeptidase [Paracoccus caeni]
MQSFTCPASGDRVYFDNLFCACGLPLYYEPEARAMWNEAEPCVNRDTIQCNWAAVPGETLCRSCAMSDVVPDLSVDENLHLLARAERAKRWVMANLSNWDWFTDTDPGARPHFQMLSENIGGRAEQITMGHLDGNIIINVTEADGLIRVQRQHQLGEQYRSMVGHFRHEIAHFLFDRLAIAPGFLDDFRAIFGDEQADYGMALQEHYANPKLPGEDFITAYATSHPHEDWAETCAHLLHIVDFTDSFVSAGLSMQGVPPGYAPYQDDDAEHLLTIAAEVAIAINDINRALDNSDLYPFVLTPRTREKIGFAHGWLKNHLQRGA